MTNSRLSRVEIDARIPVYSSYGGTTKREYNLKKDALLIRGYASLPVYQD